MRQSTSTNAYPMRIDKKRLNIRFRRFDGTVGRYPLYPEKCTPQSARLRSITPMLHRPLQELRIRIKLVAVADNRREAWFWRIILGGIHEIRGLQDRRLSSTGWFQGRRNSGNCGVLRADGYARSGFGRAEQCLRHDSGRVPRKGPYIPCDTNNIVSAQMNIA